MKSAVVRKCDLSNIPLRTFNGKVVYNWKESAGAIVPFEYDGQSGEFEIIGFVNNYTLQVKINNELKTIKIQSLQENKIKKLLPKTINWYANIGDIIKDHVGHHDRNLLITDRKYLEGKQYNKKQRKFYQYKCLTCGYDCTMDNYWVPEHLLKNNGNGCGCCAMTKIIKGLNDISTTFPEAMDYIDNPEFAYTHGKTSPHKTMMTCPTCGFKKMMSPDHLYYQSFGCPRCSDGFSYPEKFFFNILEQCHIKFKYQLTYSDFEWCGKNRYDFYLPDYNCIVEVHGKQHYEPVWKGYEEQVEIDKKKKELALNNGVLTYIELDCRYSNKDHIKHSIINSILPFDITSIDYEKADIVAQSNKLIEACKLYKEFPDMYIQEIGDRLNVSKSTIVHYLQKGRKLGFCGYRDERRSKGKEVLRKDYNKGA